MPSHWEPERDNTEWSDREAWRGDLHLEATDNWRLEVEEESAWTGHEEEGFYLEEETGWPEDLAGPEYWLFKRDCDE